MFFAIGVAGTGGATTPVAPTPSPAGPVVGTLVPVLIGWLMIATLIARRFGLFRRQTILGPERVSGDESPWLLIFLFFVAYALAGLVGPALIAHSKFTGDRKQFAEIHAVYVPFATCLFTTMSLFRKRGLHLLGIDISRLFRGVLGGAVLVCTLYPAVAAVANVEALLLHWIGRPPPTTHLVLQKIHENGSDHVLIFLLVSVAVISAPLCEELAFRGCLQTVLGYGCEWTLRMLRPTAVAADTMRPQNFPPGIAARWTAIAFTSLAFAAVHSDRGSFAPLFVLSVGLGFAYELTGNLWVTIVAHAAFNAAQILIFRAVS